MSQETMNLARAYSLRFGHSMAPGIFLPQDRAKAEELAREALKTGVPVPGWDRRPVSSIVPTKQESDGPLEQAANQT